jgi:integrase
MRELGFAISLKDSTLSAYSKVYGQFMWFISLFDLDREDPITIELFVSYLACEMKAYNSKKVKPALQYFADLEGWNLNTGNAFSRVKRGLTKVWNIVDRKRLVRDGILSSHVSDYISICKPTSNIERNDYLLTCAILVTGCRLLARPGELCNLEWSSVQIDKPKKGWLQFDLSGHKTDFFLNDLPFPVEPVTEEGVSCPVTILKQYMDNVKHFKENNSPLFSFHDDKFLSNAQISSLLKNAINAVDYH